MKMNWNMFLGGLMTAVLMGILLLGSCGNKPAYYAGQKQTDALKAAVTEDTFLLAHIKGEALQAILSEMEKLMEGDAEDLNAEVLKRWQMFLEECQLEQVQLTIDGITEEEGDPLFVLAATFGKKIDEDELVRLFKKSGDELVSKGDGEYKLGDGHLIVTGKGKVIYLGTKSLVQDAVEALKKGKGLDYPEEATATLRKGDDLYVVVVRNDCLEKVYKREVPEDVRKMIGDLPASLGVSMKAEKDWQMVLRYESETEVKDAAEGIRSGLKLLPDEMYLCSLLERAKVERKGTVIFVTAERSLLKVFKDMAEETTDVSKRIWKSQHAQELRGLFLGREIAKASPKKVVVIDNASSHVDGYGQLLEPPIVDHAIEGLKKGLGGATVEVIWQDVPKKPKPANPDEVPDPNLDIILFDAKDLMAMIPKLEGADVIVFNAMPDGLDSGIDLFKAIGLVAAKNKGVKFAILGLTDTDSLAKIFAAKDSPLIAAVVTRADYDWDADMPSNDDAAFAQQFVLLTPANFRAGIEAANRKPLRRK